MSRSIVSSTSVPATAGISVEAGRGDRAAARLCVADLAVLALELLVQLRLQATAALPLGVDESQYPGGEVAVGIDASGGRLLEDSGQHVGPGAALRPVLGRLLREDGLEVLDLLPDLRGLPPGQDRVAALRGGELLRQFGLVLAEDRGEQRRRLLRGVRGLAVLGGEQLGVGGDVVRVDAGGQGDSAAVGDLSALGGDRVLQVPVLLGLGGVRVGVDRLDLEEPDHEGQHDEGQAEADQAQPGARAAQADGLRGGTAPFRGRRRAPGAAVLGSGRGPRAPRSARRVAGARGAGYATARRFLGRHCVTCRWWSGRGWWPPWTASRESPRARVTRRGTSGRAARWAPEHSPRVREARWGWRAARWPVRALR